MFSITCLVLCLVAASHQLTISKFNVPELVEVGGSAELICEHDVQVPPGYAKWWWTPAGGTKTLLYQRIGGHQTIVKPHVDPPLNITLKTPGLDNLVLSDLQPEHTGSYACEVVETTSTNFIERTSDNTLVVYTVGSGAKLSTPQFEGDDQVQVICEAIGVAPKPDITISVLSYSFNKSVLHGPEHSLYNVFTNASFSEDDLEGQEITCKLFFEEYDIEIPGSRHVASITYHSDKWLATTAAPEDSTDTASAQGPLEATTIPGSSSHIRSSWLLFAALAIPSMLLALL